MTPLGSAPDRGADGRPGDIDPTIVRAALNAWKDESVSIYRNDFEHDSDLNYDGWPDEWSRKTGRGYPQYLKVKIEREEVQGGERNRRLVVHLDGGAAAAFTPEVPVHARFSYVVRARVRLTDFRHDAAFISIRFYDAAGKLVEVQESRKLRKAADWTQLQVGPLAPRDPTSASAVIGVHAEPVGEDYDIFAKAEFDDLLVVKIPKLLLKGNREDLIYTDPRQVGVTCELSGTSSNQAKIRFQATDVTGAVVDEFESDTTGSPIFIETAPSEDGLPPEKKIAGYHFEQSWSPKLPGHGFYRIRAQVASDESIPLFREINAVIIREIGGRSADKFGWSIQRGAPRTPRELVQLSSQAGIGWIKYPLWFDDSDTDTADELAWFTERLGNRGIQIVGVLDRPTAKQAAALFGDREDFPSAFVFSEEAVWQQMVNPIVTRLSLKVKYWQLGNDADLSYVGYPNVEETVANVKQHLERFGQDVEVGMPWRWINTRPSDKNPPWSFFSNVADPPLTADELSQYLDGLPNQQSNQWVMLTPLSAAKYDLPTRVRDLILRMMAAQAHNAGVTFISHPFHDDVGVMRSDGTPGELFLPFRTATRLLAGSEYIGSLEMPAQSQNRVFAVRDKAVVVLWSDEPKEEVLYLGKPRELKIVDVWGRVIEPQVEQKEGRIQQRISVGQLPIFVINADLKVAKWRLNCTLDRTRLASTFGRQQVVKLRFANTFSQGIGGELALRIPSVWTVTPQDVSFKAQTDENKELPLRVFLQANATSGEQRIRIDFKVDGDETYYFSVFRSLHVGLGDVDFELHSHLDENGKLVVEQHLLNRSDSEVSFNCILFTPTGRQRRQVLNAARGRRVDLYRFEEGEALVGERLWLRAEEIGGTRRILNYQIRAER